MGWEPKVADDLGETPPPTDGGAPLDPRGARPGRRLHQVAAGGTVPTMPERDPDRSPRRGPLPRRCRSPSPTGRRRSAPAGRRAPSGSARSSTASTVSCRRSRRSLGADASPRETRDEPRVPAGARPELPTAVSAEGAWIVDADGRRYLDGAGRRDRRRRRPRRARADRGGDRRSSHATQYVHGTMFTTEALERYADELAPLLPMDDPRIYPVSGGSEAVETAMKMARAYHLARGDDVAVRR